MVLNKLLSEGRVLFFDTSGIEGANKNMKKLFLGGFNYSELSLEDITILRDFYENIFSSFSNSSAEIYFPKKVGVEIYDLRIKLNKRLNFLEKTLSHKPSDYALQVRRTLGEFKVWFDSVMAIVEENIYEPVGDNSFYKLNSKIVDLSRKRHLKDKHRLDFKEDASDSRADEEVVACALSHAAHYDSSCGIFTRDFDLVRILKASVHYMHSTGQFPQVYSSMRNNPIHIYADHPIAPLHTNTMEMLDRLESMVNFDYVRT